MSCDRFPARLSLHIVKAIVEAHGGRIRVESAEGIGTSFAVSLPAMSTTSDSRGVAAGPRNPEG